MKKKQPAAVRFAFLLFTAILLLCGVLGIGLLLREIKFSRVDLNKHHIDMLPAARKKLSLNGASSKVKWSSSNHRVASVNRVGTVTAKRKGTAKITASYKGRTYTCMVNVAYRVHSAADGMRYRDAEGSFCCTGRWYKKEINGEKRLFTSTDGSAVYFKLIGSRYADVSFVTNTQEEPYFAYSVDGGQMKRQRISENVVDAGDAGVHYIRLVVDSMSESENRWEGEAGTGIADIRPQEKNGAVTAVKPENPVIAFFGDSITQGVRVLNMELAPSGTSASHSYAWHCAEQLGMTPYYAGFGGSGIMESGSFANFFRTVEQNSVSTKTAAFDADIIVLEHGTNDVYAESGDFLAEYKKALELLHRKHPSALIVSVIPFTQIHAEEIREAAAGFDGFCRVIETDSWDLTYTDGLHPDTQGAEKAGRKLAEEIISVQNGVWE